MATRSPARHPVFAHAARADAAFAGRLGNWPAAERAQRKVLQRLDSATGLPIDLTVARAELAGILAHQRQQDATRRLLGTALPAVHEALDPLAATDRLAAQQVADCGAHDWNTRGLAYWLIPPHRKARPC